MTMEFNYVGPDGPPCSHYRIDADRVACGYNYLKPPKGERHRVVTTLRATTCTACLVSVAQNEQ